MTRRHHHKKHSTPQVVPDPLSPLEPQQMASHLHTYTLVFVIIAICAIFAAVFLGLDANNGSLLKDAVDTSTSSATTTGAAVTTTLTPIPVPVPNPNPKPQPQPPAVKDTSAFDPGADAVVYVCGTAVGILFLFGFYLAVKKGVYRYTKLAGFIAALAVGLGTLIPALTDPKFKKGSGTYDYTFQGWWLFATGVAFITLTCFLLIFWGYGYATAPLTEEQKRKREEKREKDAKYKADKIANKKKYQEDLINEVAKTNTPSGRKSDAENRRLGGLLLAYKNKQTSIEASYQKRREALSVLMADAAKKNNKDLVKRYAKALENLNKKEQSDLKINYRRANEEAAAKGTQVTLKSTTDREIKQNTSYFGGFFGRAKAGASLENDNQTVGIGDDGKQSSSTKGTVGALQKAKKREGFFGTRANGIYNIITGATHNVPGIITEAEKAAEKVVINAENTVEGVVSQRPRSNEVIERPPGIDIPTNTSIQPMTGGERLPV